MDEKKALVPLPRQEIRQKRVFNPALPYYVAMGMFLGKYRTRHSLNAYLTMQYSLRLWPKMLRIPVDMACDILLSDENLRKGFAALNRRKVHGQRYKFNSQRTVICSVLVFRNRVYKGEKNHLSIKKFRDLIGDYSRLPRYELGKEPRIFKIGYWDVRLASILAYEEGLLPSEIVVLKSKNFKKNHLECGVRGRKRKVKYGPLLIQYLQRNGFLVWRKKSYIFLTRTGKPRRMAESTLRRLVKRSFRESGIDKGNLMILRKEGILHRVKKIKEPDPLSKVLGYVGTQSVRRYKKAVQGAQRTLQPDYRFENRSKSDLIVELSKRMK